MPGKQIIIILLSLIVSLLAKGQVQGYFTADTIKIGQPVKYYLVFRHAPSTEVLFPDNKFDFSPFELIKKEFFPTATDSSGSTDSVIYVLRTFDIGEPISYTLPVFILSEQDTIIKKAIADTVLVKEYIHQLPDSLKLMENTSFNVVKKEINYPYYIAGGTISLLLLFFLFVFFGKPLTKRYRLFLVRRTHVIFLRQFQRLEREYKKNGSITVIEDAVSVWKNYLSRLEDKPINTYTTTEISVLFNKEELKESLKTIDRTVYGGFITNEAETALSYLKKFSNKRFQKRKKEINNAGNKS